MTFNASLAAANELNARYDLRFDQLDVDATICWSQGDADGCAELNTTVRLDRSGLVAADALVEALTVGLPEVMALVSDPLTGGGVVVTLNPDDASSSSYVGSYDPLSRAYSAQPWVGGVLAEEGHGGDGWLRRTVNELVEIPGGVASITGTAMATFSMAQAGLPNYVGPIEEPVAPLP